jgi:two-component system LytT family sensor kinase
MAIKFSSYQKCQLGGWLLYGLIRLSHAFLIAPLTYYSERIITSVLLGLIATHLLRELIRRFSLRPPLKLYKLPLIMGIVSGTLVFHAWINSAMAEWLNLYNPQIRMSVGKRVLANFILDSPAILVWVSIYYLWHYVQLGTATDKKISDLEKTAKQMKQELGFSEV